MSASSSKRTQQADDEDNAPVVNKNKRHEKDKRELGTGR